MRCLLLSILFTFLVLSVGKAFAQDDTAKRYEDLQNQIRELETKLSEVKNREQTLSSQIVYMDNQIRLTTLRISSTAKKIENLTTEIASLSAKIGELEVSLTQLSDILLNRIIVTYKRGNIPTVELLFGSEDFGDLLLRVKYLKIAQSHDKKLMFQMQETKDNFTVQKTQREDKKRELENLNRLLEAENSKLNQQRKDKDILLQITRSDEHRYQELLASARAEQAAIEAALRLSIAYLKDGTPVKKGEQIALIGNSGTPYCSTGVHLHIEFRKDNGPQNPANYLKQTDVTWENSPDGPFTFSGDWDWPISSPRITQGYGMTSWARTGFYSGGPHTGIDMTSSNHIIRAPRDGTLYKGRIGCRSTSMNYIAIDHGEGLVTWYFHVQ